MAQLIISTDFDGTLISQPETAPFAPCFIDKLNELEKKNDVIWVINTGRHWQILEQSLREIAAPRYPDWAVVIEREVLQIKDNKPHELKDWNHHCRRAHKELFEKSRSVFHHLRKALEAFKGIQITDDHDSPFGLIALNLEQAHEIEQTIRHYINQFPELILVRNTIYFRFAHRDYTKGTSLQAIANHYQLPASACFAVGDNLNDIPMLHRDYAHHIACPGNAMPVVKEHVANQQGYIAQQTHAAGVTEALNYFFK
ncbi:MAG: HAD family hydrolase [Verrucomicrobiota bacterium]